jgi:hypothetical protein
MRDMGSDLEPVELTSMIRAWILSKREGKELDLKVAGHGDPDKPTRIEIIGGLPSLPGAKVTMPTMA